MFHTELEVAAGVVGPGRVGIHVRTHRAVIRARLRVRVVRELGAHQNRGRQLRTDVLLGANKDVVRICVPRVRIVVAGGGDILVQGILAVMVNDSIAVTQFPDRVGHGLPVGHDRSEVLDAIQQRRKTAGAVLIVIPIIVLILEPQSKNRRQFGVERQMPVVVNVILLRAQRHGNNAPLQFRFLRVVEHVADLELVSFRDGVVHLQADQVAVVGIVRLAGLKIAHVINVTETDQRLVQRQVDRQRRAQFDTPARLFRCSE